MRRSASSARLSLLFALVSLSSSFFPAHTVGTRAALSPPASAISGPPPAPTAQDVVQVPVDSAPPPLPDPPPASLPARATTSSAPVPTFGHLPLTFIPNVGQFGTDPVRFVARGPQAELRFGPDELLLTLPVTVPHPEKDTPSRRDRRPADQTVGLGRVHMRLERANRQPVVSGTTPLPGVANYFIGDNPAQWYTKLPTYQGLRYAEVYPGIDLLYDGSTGQLKSTYVVAPGVDPNQIRWRYLGGTRPQLDAAGNLQFTVPVRLPGALALPLVPDETGTAVPAAPAAPAVQATVSVTVTEQAPLAWQEIKGQQVPVAVQFVIEQNEQVGFTLGRYDAQYPLIIDPTLVFSSFLGGAGADEGNGLALDAQGNIYVAGRTLSATLPGGTGTRTTYDAYVLKLNPTGTQALYTTFIGGDGDDSANSVAVDSSGQAYIVGGTASSTLPVVSAYQGALSGTEDALVAKLTAAGGIAYLTYLGGTSVEYGTDIAVNSAGEAHITGSTFSSTFPRTNPFLDTFGGLPNDLFVTKLASSGSSAIYSSFLGGSRPDEPGGIALDAAGNAYVTGQVSGNRSGYSNPK